MLRLSFLIPNEKWFEITDDTRLPDGLLDDNMKAIYDPENELRADMLVDLNTVIKIKVLCYPLRKTIR